MPAGPLRRLGEEGEPVGTEDFRCAPGPMGWRYFSEIETTEPAPHHETIDIAVDAAWRPVRVRIDTGAHRPADCERRGHRRASLGLPITPAATNLITTKRLTARPRSTWSSRARYAGSRRRDASALRAARRGRSSTRRSAGSMPLAGRTRRSTVAGRPTSGSRATSSSATTGSSSWSGYEPGASGPRTLPSGTNGRPRWLDGPAARVSPNRPTLEPWRPRSRSRCRRSCRPGRPPASTAMFQVMSQSSRSIVVFAETPKTGLPSMSEPAPRNSPLSVTGFVMSLIVRSPSSSNAVCRRWVERPCCVNVMHRVGLDLQEVPALQVVVAHVRCAVGCSPALISTWTEESSGVFADHDRSGELGEPSRAPSTSCAGGERDHRVPLVELVLPDGRHSTPSITLRSPPCDIPLSFMSPTSLRPSARVTRPSTAPRRSRCRPSCRAPRRPSRAPCST